MATIKLNPGERAHITSNATVVCTYGSWLDRVLMLRFLPAKLRQRITGTL